MRNRNSGIKYIIHEGKRTVVAKFKKDSDFSDKNYWSGMFYDVIHNIGKKVDNTEGYYYINRFWLDEDESERYLGQLSNHLCGIARCHDKDKFDVEIGKEIARKKLLAKYYKFEKHMLKSLREDMIKSFEGYLTEISKRIDLCEHKIKTNAIKKETYDGN